MKYFATDLKTEMNEEEFFTHANDSGMNNTLVQSAIDELTDTEVDTITIGNLSNPVIGRIEKV